MTGPELTAETRLFLLRWELSLSWEAPHICCCLLSWPESDTEKERMSTRLSNTWINAANASSPQTQLDSAILKPFKRSMGFYHGSCSDWWSGSAYLYLPSQTSSGTRGALLVTLNVIEMIIDMQPKQWLECTQNGHSGCKKITLTYVIISAVFLWLLR